MIQWGLGNTGKGDPLGRRRKTTARPTPAGWTIKNEVRVNGRILRPGTEFKAIEHGSPEEGRRRLVRVRFTGYVQTPTAEWVEGIDTDRHYRAFRLDRIVTVHRITRMRGAAA